MNLRTIMIFPKFDNVELINQIRNEYDPLADLVKPHITIVFPFKSEMNNQELYDILDKRLCNIKKFEIELQGFSKSEDRFGNYLFLNVITGNESIITIHNCLYDNEFQDFDLGLEYLPHITVGKFACVQELDRAYEEIKDIECNFISVIDTITIEMIGDNEESIVVMEKQLD